MRGATRPAYRFGPFLLDVAEQRLLQDGDALPLTPKVFDVLRVLVQNSGHLIEKERLLAEVWPDSFVEEGALSRNISVLRKTLGESGSEPKYIETVPKKGYRFVAAVTQEMLGGSAVSVEPPDKARDTAEAPASMSAAETPAKREWLSVSLAAAGAAGVVLGISALLLSVAERSGRATPAATTIAPLHREVTFTGKERSPAVSPDGRRIAYVSHEKTEKNLIVQELAGGSPLTIFTASELGYVRWSPDGSELLFWARGPGTYGVYILPQLGGTPRRVADRPFIVGGWSPDGSTIAVASYVDGKIAILDKAGRELRNISLRDVNWSIWDIDWSANDVLTFVSSDYQGRYTIWTMKPDGSEQQRAVLADSEIPVARWAPEGDAIYYFRRVNQTYSLFKIPFTSSPELLEPTAATLIAGLESDRLFSLSADGRRLVYARAPYHSNLWLVDADGDQDGSIRTRELTSGTSPIERPSVSPDGRSIVFNVGHGAATNLYSMSIDGGVKRQITFLDSLNVGAVWSADGQWIAFASTEGGQPRIRIVNAAGGTPQAVSSTDLSDNFDLTWAPGSRILYQQSGNRNYYELYPGRQSERLLINDSTIGWLFFPVHSPDGRKIGTLWNRPRKRGIWVLDSTNGREDLVYATASPLARPLAWSADGTALYVLEGKNSNFRGPTAPLGETITGARVVRVPLDGDAVTTVAVFPFDEIGGVSMTPDGRRFVCVVYSSRADVWVVDDFDASP